MIVLKFQIKHPLKSVNTPKSNNNEKSCWDLAEKMRDFRFDYKICQDCIVHVYSLENNESISSQLENILRRRKTLNNKTC